MLKITLYIETPYQTETVNLKDEISVVANNEYVKRYKTRSGERKS
ncbi:MAG TPA: hypothetical protein VGP58_12855 [Pyrinomonadaceae bacterium]|nr:hypothetical protein [Pyrinomonadaceae bacterium]